MLVWSSRKNRCALAIIVAAAFWTAAAPAREHEIWFCQNGGTAVWGDDSDPSNRTYYEEMYPDPVFGVLSICDLDPANTFLGGAWLHDRYFHSWHWWAEVWLANHFDPIVPRQVDVEFWKGAGITPYERIATASVMVNNGPPGARYVFDFGAHDILAHLDTIFLKIIYHGVSGDTQVYWHHETCPTALHAEGEPLGVEPATWRMIKGLYKR